jgi:DNA-binding CsgD family transcriptional regulator
VSFNDPTIKTEFIRSAIFEKLRTIADTCKNPLVALYALYKSKFDRNYSVNQQFYENFLTKWKDQKSEYFNKFREKIPSSPKKGLGLIIFIAILSLVIGFLASLIYFKFFKKNQNLIQNLSVQERKIFALLLEGKSNKEISENLSIGLNTVKTHLNNIYSKLDVKSRKDVMNLNHDK